MLQQIGAGLRGESVARHAAYRLGLAVFRQLVGRLQHQAGDAFATLENLRQALLSNSASQISGTLGDIESSRAQMVRVQSEAGLIMNRLDTADEALGVTALELSRQDSALGDVDPFAAISELTQLSTTLEQSIAVARQTLTTGRDLF